MYISQFDEDMALSLSTKAIEVFEHTHISKDVKFTKDRLMIWEEKLSSIVPELKALSNKDILLKVYSTVLSKSSMTELNSLQLSSFQLITSAIADSLVKAFPKSIAITSLVDEVTDIHLDFIESFQALTQGRESSERYCTTYHVGVTDSHYITTHGVYCYIDAYHLALSPVILLQNLRPTKSSFATSMLDCVDTRTLA